MDAVGWLYRPQLRRPVLIAAFEGWNDAGDAASTAARWLAAAWTARPFATIDPEEFYDFTTTRPQVRLDEGLTRRIDWPTNGFAEASLPAVAHDVVLLHGVEPQLKWRTFTALVIDVATQLGVELVITLGALLADVPHTRPVRVTGTADDPALVRRLGLQRSRYEGPTGIVGVLHDRCREAGIHSASLWAAVPHYVAQTPSPKATLALVNRAADLVGVPVDVDDLADAAATYESQVSEVVAQDDEVADYVHRLEASADEEARQAELPEVAGGDALADEVERFLRDQRPRD